VACFHPSVERCARCLRRDPTAAAPPVPWEAEGRSLPFRYFATLASALSPMRSAPAFARPDVRVAQRFALLSAVPFAWLAGVIPHTRTLLFKSNLEVEVLNHATSSQIALDVVRAGAVQLTVTSLELLCLMLPFVSLVRAYAPTRHHAAARMLYYRVWMLPAASLLLYAAFWLLPTADPQNLGQAPTAALMLFELLVTTAVPVLLLSAMFATARLACGLGPFVSMVVVAVPAVLLFVVQSLLQLGVTRVLPQLAAGAG
jgi:hypothetical protein